MKVGEQTLSTNVYATDRSSLLKEVQYGNGGKAKYAYDDFDRLISVSYDAATSPRFTYEYGANGRVARVTDSELTNVETYEYDLAERPMQYTRRDASGTIIYQTTVQYDKMNQLKTFREYVNGAQDYKTSYFYDRDGRAIRQEYIDNAHKVEYAYDAVGRVSSRKATNGTNVFTSTYVFEGGSTSLYGANATTPLAKEIQQTGMNLSYTYDSRGNITGETRNNATTNYFYDGMGQLIRVNDPHEGATWRYEYDRGGNMTKTRKYAYTTASEPGTTPVDTVLTYSATWKDQLVKFGDRNIAYDPIGNMLTDGVHANTWEYGRQLRRTELTSGEHAGIIYRYAYNKDGLRTVKRKIVGGTSTYAYYAYSGNRVTHYTGNGYAMHFFYDAQGKVSMTRFWNGTVSKYYTYVYNLQGDVVKLVGDDGATAVEYKYDAWGKLLSTTGTLAGSLGEANPFRYRGYVYDEETKYYYLRSRYYDPELRRFISADALFSDIYALLGLNIYAYCKNAPVAHQDPDGYDERPSIYSLTEEQYDLLLRSLVNMVCGDGYFSAKGKGTFTVKEGLSISQAQAESHNKTVSNVLTGVSFAFGAALSGATAAFSGISAIFLGGATTFGSSSIQNDIAGQFTIEDGDYMSISGHYQYSEGSWWNRMNKTYIYEVRIFSDCIEVWETYSDNNIGIMPARRGYKSMETALLVDFLLDR